MYNLCVFTVKCFCCACYPFYMRYVCVKGTYVYSVASIVFGDSGVGIAKSVLRKCVVSLMYEGINGTSGLRKWSM